WLARAMQCQRKYKEAIDLQEETLKQVRRIDLADQSETINILHLLAYTYSLANNIDKSKECYAEALALNDKHKGKKDRTSANLLTDLASLEMGQRNYQKAFDLDSEAIARDPVYAYAYCCRGHANQYLQHDEQSVSDFTKSIELDSKQTDSH